MPRPYIAAIGPGEFEPGEVGDKIRQLAFEAGMQIASSGAVLVCGGMSGAGGPSPR